MAKQIREVVEDLRQDIVRWRREMDRLRAEGHADLAEHMSLIVAEAERVVSRWDSYHE